MEKNNQENEIEVTNTELARMIQEGFLGMGQRFDKIEGDVAVLKTDVAGLKTDVAGLKTDVAEIKVKVSRIETEIVKKVDKIDHNTLEYRMDKLEKKFA